jgi:hypothetical protein
VDVNRTQDKMATNHPAVIISHAWVLWPNLVTVLRKKEKIAFYKGKFEARNTNTKKLST